MIPFSYTASEGSYGINVDIHCNRIFTQQEISGAAKTLGLEVQFFPPVKLAKTETLFGRTLLHYKGKPYNGTQRAGYAEPKNYMYTATTVFPKYTIWEPSIMPFKGIHYGREIGAPTSILDLPVFFRDRAHWEKWKSKLAASNRRRTPFVRPRTLWERHAQHLINAYYPEGTLTPSQRENWVTDFCDLYEEHLAAIQEAFLVATTVTSMTFIPPYGAGEKWDTLVETEKTVFPLAERTRERLEIFLHNEYEKAGRGDEPARKGEEVGNTDELIETLFAAYQQNSWSNLFAVRSLIREELEAKRSESITD